MKTEIEIFDVTETRNGVKVDYALHDEKGVANVKQTIPSEKLEEYIIDNDLNDFYYHNAPEDSVYVHPEIYLTENLNNVVLAYLQDLADKAAKEMGEAA